MRANPDDCRISLLDYRCWTHDGYAAPDRVKCDQALRGESDEF